MKKLLMFFALMIGLVSCGSGDNTPLRNLLKRIEWK